MGEDTDVGEDSDEREDTDEEEDHAVEEGTDEGGDADDEGLDYEAEPCAPHWCDC